MKKFYKTTYTVVVLSEDTPATAMNLADVAYAIDEGNCVGEVDDDGGVELTPAAMAAALFAVRSEPGFFGLGPDGESADDDIA